MQRGRLKPPFMPTPRQITDGAAAIRAGWDERELLMRTGLSAVEAAERVDGQSYSVPEVVVEPGEGVAAE